jgi:D-alanine-D-alanine ligase
MSTKIAVLMGGPSSEREVSLSSGKAMFAASAALGYDAISVEFENDILSHLDTLKSVDIVLIALHGGIGENGRIQGMFESLGIRYTGSDALSSAICMDKHISKLLAEDVGIATPRWKRIRKGQSIYKNEFDYPFVVKPNSEGSTIGLTIVHNENDYDSAVEEAFKYDDEILIEEFISGKEITVSIVGEDVLPIIEIRPEHGLYDYECKYTKGMTEYICPAELNEDLTKRIKQTAFEVYKLLKCRHYGRVDLRLDNNNQHWFLELNTLPGMTDTSLLPKAAKATGISFEQLIGKIIKQSLD